MNAKGMVALVVLLLTASANAGAPHEAPPWAEELPAVEAEVSRALKQLIGDSCKVEGTHFQHTFAALQRQIAGDAELAERIGGEGGLVNVAKRVAFERFSLAERVPLGRELLALAPMPGGVDENTLFQLLDLGAFMVVRDSAGTYVAEAAGHVFAHVIESGYRIDDLLTMLMLSESVAVFADEKKDDWTAENNRFLSRLCGRFLEQSQAPVARVLISLCCVRSCQAENCTADELRDAMDGRDTFPTCK